MRTWFLWWVDDTETCQMDPQRFDFASLLVDVASQFQVSNAKGVTLSGASTSSRFSDRQHMGSWKRDPVSSTTLTNFCWLTHWQSSQALHKAQLHEEQTGTWRHTPFLTFLDTKELCTTGKFVVFLSMGIEIKAPSLKNFITTSSPFTTEWPPWSWWYICEENNQTFVNGRW